MNSAVLPLVTVMVPVRNERRFITDTLGQLYRQGYPKDRYEVIVVDGQSTDGTRQVAEKFARDHPTLQLRTLDNPRRLSSAARNLAVHDGRGEYFLLVDGHVYIPSDDLIADAVRLAQEHQARVLGRPQPLTPPGLSRFQQAIAVSRASPLAHSKESFIYSNYQGWTSPISIGVMYHRSVFTEFGMFDEAFDAAEDLEFNYRLELGGLECYTAPCLTVCYYPRESLLALFRQMTRYGEGRARFLQKHPQRFRLETIVPALALIAAVFLAVLGAVFPVLWIVLLCLAGLYAMLILAETLRLSVSRGYWLLLYIPRIIPAVHAGLGYGMLKGLFRGMRRYCTKAWTHQDARA